jgi:hypothetical protein
MPIKEHQISIRLEPGTTARAAALATGLRVSSPKRFPRLSRAAVLRMAMNEGLGLLEHRLDVQSGNDSQ